MGILYRIRKRRRTGPLQVNPKKGSMNMKKLEQLYEGKAKKVFQTDDPACLIVEYKDDATAFNGQKKGTILGKGAINNRMTNLLMQMLEHRGVPTHFVQELNERETVVKKVTIVPLEVIVRNISAGHFAQNYGVEEGIVFEEPTIEFSYKNDDLGDPLINSYHAKALKLATQAEIDTIVRLAFQINEALKEFFLAVGITLVDFKLEFGRLEDGQGDRRKAGQGPLPPGPGQCGRCLPRGDEAPDRQPALSPVRGPMCARHTGRRRKHLCVESSDLPAIKTQPPFCWMG